MTWIEGLDDSSLYRDVSIEDLDGPSTASADLVIVRGAPIVAYNAPSPLQSKEIALLEGR